MRAAAAPSSRSSPSRFAASSAMKKVYAGHVAARPGEAGDKAEFDRVVGDAEDDRNGRGRSLGRERRRGAAGAAITATCRRDQLGRQRRQSVVLALGLAVFDRHVLALDIAGLFSSPGERPLSRRAIGPGDSRRGTRSPASPAAARAPRAATPPPRRREA